MKNKKILVIGTTPDYIRHLARVRGDRVLFVTDRSHVASPLLRDVPNDIQLFCDLTDQKEVQSCIEMHCAELGLKVKGITCYDCEWLLLAAKLAQHFGLVFTDPEAVSLCRDKYRSKKVWKESGVRCPETALVGQLQEAVTFVRRLERPVVMKPVTGSGSELTFRCEDHREVISTFQLATSGLRARSRNPMYNESQTGRLSEPTLLIEEFIAGREYSCDFIVDRSRVKIIRTARKVPQTQGPFGTTLAYLVPAELPEGVSENDLNRILERAASALGVTRAICMVDFMIHRREIVLLELTPRPGGDCLPALIRHSCGLDVIGLAVDFAAGETPSIPPSESWKPLVGLRLFADRGGHLRSIDTSRVVADSQVVAVELIREPGHRISLPPDDYTSWLLGHAILKYRPDLEIADECRRILDLLRMHIEAYHEKQIHSNAR